jgi:transcriptional regulator with XRE-family HTH domain
MMSPSQFRMARAGLGWTLGDVAEKAGVNLNTVSRFESGREILSGTLERLERVLLDEGVNFINESADGGAGVRLPPIRDEKAPPPSSRKKMKRKPKAK